MAWTIISGPREFDSLADFDIDVGWGYTLQRGDETVVISVLVAGRRLGSPELRSIEECRRAVATKGKSAVEAVLDRERPPRYLTVTTTGIGERATE